MDNNTQDMIDISSISTNANREIKKQKNPIKNVKFPIVKATGFKSLGNIVKVISFIVAISVFAVFVLAAYLLFAFRPLYLTMSIAIVAFGIIVALILLFLIYALGHIVNQNNEIIDILKGCEDTSGDEN